MATRTNLLLNPSAETNTTNIQAGNTGSTITRVATGATVGASALQVVCDGLAATQGLVYITGTGLGGSSVPVVASFDFTTSITQAMSFRLRFFYTDATNALQTALIVTPAIGTTRITIPVATSDGAKTLNQITLNINVSGTRAMTFQTDAAIVERSAVSQSYFDGSFPGASWSGTAHASTSVLTVPDDDPHHIVQKQERSRRLAILQGVGVI
jgi:hypothetical protein